LKAKADKTVDEEKKILHNFVSVLQQQRRDKQAVPGGLGAGLVERMFFKN